MSDCDVPPVCATICWKDPRRAEGFAKSFSSVEVVWLWSVLQVRWPDLAMSAFHLIVSNSIMCHDLFSQSMFNLSEGKLQQWAVQNVRYAFTRYNREYTIQGYIRICSFYVTSEVFYYFLTFFSAPSLLHPPANTHLEDQKWNSTVHHNPELQFIMKTAGHWNGSTRSCTFNCANILIRAGFERFEMNSGDDISIY